MKTRLLAFAVLVGVYVMAPLVAPKQHTVFASYEPCYCDHVGEKYADGGSGTYVGTATLNNVFVGYYDWEPYCRQACWDAAYAWAQNEICLWEDLWYVRTTTYSWIDPPSGLQGSIGPGDIPCPE